MDMLLVNFIQVVNGRARQSPMLYAYVFLNQILQKEKDSEIRNKQDEKGRKRKVKGGKYERRLKKCQGTHKKEEKFFPLF